MEIGDLVRIRERFARESRSLWVKRSIEEQTALLVLSIRSDNPPGYHAITLLHPEVGVVHINEMNLTKEMP
ncbi:hypothetical protein CMI47_14495 [Candidatus Pacearchaeota archaeon]|nr:hypothetical protein [Candidatus Pacearchaeota archaeon]|tara:strand:+ start:1568 stop:1780 length:213 start_codon:yes stop_codon:yes gene_type:complete